MSRKEAGILMILRPVSRTILKIMFLFY